MDSQPAVSIVMPLYNKAGQVLRTVETVRAQSFPGWELVVVDDGSSDDGADRVAALRDHRIRIFRQPNGGVASARNRGIRESHSELVAFLDADDLWHPEYLATIMQLKTDFPAASWYATSYECQPQSGAARPCVLRGVPTGFQRGILDSYFQVASRSEPPVWTSSVAALRTALLAVDGFPAGIASGEDLLTWAKLATRYRLAYDTQPRATFVASGIERAPDPDDRVGASLQLLARANAGMPGLREYVALWYRMRAVMFLRFGDRASARHAAWLSLRLAPARWRNAYTWALACLPRGWHGTVDQLMRSMLRLAGRSRS